MTVRSDFSMPSRDVCRRVGGRALYSYYYAYRAGAAETV